MFIVGLTLYIDMMLLFNVHKRPIYTGHNLIFDPAVCYKLRNARCVIEPAQDLRTINRNKFTTNQRIERKSIHFFND